MIREYGKFFINGGILGIVAWQFQLLIYAAMGDGGLNYTFASALTYIPLVVINFAIQRKFIFQSSGLFSRFVAANLAIMILVSILSPIFQTLVDWVVGNPWGTRAGFVLAALVGSIPSFFLKRHWVFGKSFKN